MSRAAGRWAGEMFRTAIMMSASLALTSAVVAHAYYLKHQFYPTVVYLTKSSPSMAVLYIQAFVLVFLLGKFMGKVFFGQLRAAEMEHLLERSWYAVTETCLAFTVFRDDFSPRFVALFTLLLFLKCFHWLAEDRVDFMERSPNISWLFHFRIVSLMLLLGILDFLFVNHAYHSILTRGASVQLVFGFEREQRYCSGMRHLPFVVPPASYFLPFSPLLQFWRLLLPLSSALGLLADKTLLRRSVAEISVESSASFNLLASRLLRPLPFFQLIPASPLRQLLWISTATPSPFTGKTHIKGLVAETPLGSLVAEISLYWVQIRTWAFLVEELRWRGEPDQEFYVEEEPAKLRLAEAATCDAVSGLWEIDPAVVEVGTGPSRPELPRPDRPDWDLLAIRTKIEPLESLNGRRNLCNCTHHRWLENPWEQMLSMNAS
uniref:Uncharacterized protein n=1 Tax=Sphaerodactylus townsendi TaxID=933632 RepID=A0ACB8G981_9SAUR